MRRRTDPIRYLPQQVEDLEPSACCGTTRRETTLSTEKRVLAYGLALFLAGGLQACCVRTGETTGDAGAGEAGAAKPIGALEITDWGPRRSKAGVAFNANADGHAAIWIRVNQPLDGRIAKIQFDDAILVGRVSGRLVTAMVPEALYAKQGTFTVRVIVRQGNAYQGSNKVKFTVE